MLTVDTPKCRDNNSKQKKQAEQRNYTMNPTKAEVRSTKDLIKQKDQAGSKQEEKKSFQAKTSKFFSAKSRHFYVGVLGTTCTELSQSIKRMVVN